MTVKQVEALPESSPAAKEATSMLDLLDQAAKAMIDSNAPVIGTFVHVHFADGRVLKFHGLSQTLNLLAAIGGFELAKAELANQIIQGSNERQNPC